MPKIDIGSEEVKNVKSIRQKDRWTPETSDQKNSHKLFSHVGNNNLPRKNLNESILR